ncbi:MAG: MarR family transcriptional regulator [Oscillospiraceae bacterium]|nr:MarR family transcriptional regulator [Oscillospiraceae bacterium]
MKSMNIISRCQSIFRSKNTEPDLCAAHHSLVLAICRNPNSSQDELAKDICLNKSTVTRALTQLENSGYVKRTPNPLDKRQVLVEPTEKMLAVLPKVRSVTMEWNRLIFEGIPEEELKIFNTVIKKIEENARKAIEEKEVSTEI